MGKDTKPAFDYNAELKRLKESGPERLYLLFGPEEYLREKYLGALREMCVGGAEELSCRRLNGPAVDMGELAEAVNALPFFTERSFVEVRDYDFGRCKDAEWEALSAIAGDVPDWCTVVFVQSAGNAPDGRLAAVKGLKKLGRAVEFTEQDVKALTGWVRRHFADLGKRIAPEDAEYLIFLCGTGMLGLIPQIEKAAAHAAGDIVTRADVDATVDRVPEANVWTMNDLLSARKTDEAARILSDLLGDKDNSPIYLNALIGMQFRRMYAMSAGREEGLDRRALMDLCDVKYDSLYQKLAAAARAYTTARLGELVSLCAEYDYKMKSTGADPEALLRELFARLAAE